MSSVNKATILGNVGKDPELRSTGNGQSVCNFSIATSEKWKDKASGEMKESTEWHNLVAWGKQAEIIAKYVQKGSKLYVEGRLQTRSYEKDGVKRYSTEIVVSDFVLLGGKGQSGETSKQGAGPSSGAGGWGDPPPAQGQGTGQGDDDVPF